MSGARPNDLYDGDTEGLAGLRPVEQILAIAGGLIGGALVLVGWGIATAVHLNRKARSHRP